MSAQEAGGIPVEKKRSYVKKKYDDSNNRSYSSAKGFPYKKHNVTHNTEAQVNNFRARYKEISPEAQMVVDQILDPEKQMSVARFPSYGVSAIYQAENVLQSQYDANGRSMVAVSPTLGDTILATAGSQYTQTLASQTTNSVNPNSVQSFQIPEGGSNTAQWWTEPIRFHDEHLALPFPHAATGQMLYPIGASQLSTGVGTCIMIFQGPQTGVAAQFNVSVNWYDSAFALLLNQTSTATFAGLANFASLSAALFTGNLPVYMSISIRSNSTGQSAFSGKIGLSWYDNVSGGGLVPAIMAIANQAQHCISYSVNNAATILDSGEQYMVSAQSCLLTYEGSDLNNAGALAIARIPGDSPVGYKGGVATLTSWYQFIASLQRNKYEGATKHGGYAFYLGEDARSYFYRPVEDQGFGPYPYIAAEWTTDSTSPQVVRIKVSTIVQFTTNSNIYDQKPSCYLGTDYDMILYIMSNINAAYDNPGHRAKLTAALKKVGTKVVSLLKNPKTYTTLGTLIATLL